ncbi:Uncharacterized conserved protein, DUF2252 family [Polynucleobacter meluiroseus]|uniref:Uncharacterized conserved protein, DUF2252 family n=1 Tax=Polynucleobacter meluiroseus TaxID=1938814 RepID=A0A240E2I6_9BURK|nr:DUF2252 domain-containing protein [Polynucleobacter meluiroseus]SNX28711.1 Uncharacterized conserved protein, DUF2252 family [Polynucleobacter meluiroseus]
MSSDLYNSFLSKNPSIQDRFDQGKAIRKQVNRSSLAEMTVVKKRQTPIDLLLDQAKTRIPEYVPIRHARMAANPFAFFRGGAAIFAYDLSTLPSPPISVQLGGDMHVSNFGFFSTTEHRLVFGINDFDETLPGHFDWDLKRLTASAMIAAHGLGQDQAYGESIVRAIVKTYRQYLLEYAHTPYIELMRTYIDEKHLLKHAINANVFSQKTLAKILLKAKKNTNTGVIGKLTKSTPEGQRLIDHPPLVEHIEISIHGRKITALLDAALNTYTQSLLVDRRNLLMRYKIIDWVRKVVGVGSVGTSCWVIYFEGLDASDPLFLQVKEAQASVLAPYFPHTPFATHGERVVTGQHLIQGAPDPFLGFGSTLENDLYIRQLRDMKGGISIGEGGIDVHEFPDFAKLFGWALANAHARSGDPAVLAGYCGQSEALDDAMVQFSIAYAQQNASDYETFLLAIKSGKVSCATRDF